MLFSFAEINLNLFENVLSLLLAEFIDKPFSRLSIMFAVVARLTRWKNVVWRICSTFVYWNMMLLLQDLVLVKQAWAMTAVGARAMPIFKSLFPIKFSKSRGKCSFPTAFLVLILTHLVRILLAPVAASFPCFLLVQKSIVSASRSIVVRMVFTPLLTSLPLFFGIVVVTLARFGALIFSVLLILELFLVLYFLFVIFLIEMNGIEIFLTMLSIFYILVGIATCSTLRLKSNASTFVRRIKIFSGWIPQFAFGTTFNRGRFVDHDVSLSPYLMMSSAGGEISHFSGIGLSDDSLLYRMIVRSTT